MQTNELEVLGYKMRILELTVQVAHLEFEKLSARRDQLLAAPVEVEVPLEVVSAEFTE